MSEDPTSLLALATTGANPSPWPPLHTHLLHLLSTHTNPPTSPFPHPPSPAELALLTHLTTQLTHFTRSPPHTLQRLAELLRAPTTHYTARIKWLRALERVLSVESGMESFPLDGAGGGSMGGLGAVNGLSLGSDESLGGALLTRIPWLGEHGEGEGAVGGPVEVGVVDTGKQPEKVEEMGDAEGVVDGEGEGVEKKEEEEVGKVEEMGEVEEAKEEAGKEEETGAMETAETVETVEKKDEAAEAAEAKIEDPKKDADGDIEV